MPEILFYISQNRLCYLAQLARRRADTLLSLSERELPAPWVILVKQDLLQLWVDRHTMFQSLGNLVENATAWANYITRFPHQWKRQVRSWMRWMQTQNPKQVRVQVCDMRRVLCRRQSHERLTRREHFSIAGLQPVVPAVSVGSSFQRDFD